MNVHLKSVLVVVLILNLGSISSTPITGQISINSTTVAPDVTITNEIVADSSTEKPGFLVEFFEEVIEEVEDFFNFNGKSEEEVKAAPIENSQTTIHRQTVIIENGMVVNETHTIETVSENAPIVTVSPVDVTTAAPEAVSPVILDNTDVVESDSKPTPKSTYTVYKSSSITVIRKKSPLLPSNLFQKMIDILNQPDRIIPQIEVPEDSNIVVEKFHYK